MSIARKPYNPEFAHRFGLNSPSSPAASLQAAIEAGRERAEIVNQIIATSDNPEQTRRILLACDLIYRFWSKSNRICRESLRDYGFKVEADGTVTNG